MSIKAALQVFILSVMLVGGAIQARAATYTVLSGSFGPEGVNITGGLGAFRQESSETNPLYHSPVYIEGDLSTPEIATVSAEITILTTPSPNPINGGVGYHGNVDGSVDTGTSTPDIRFLRAVGLDIFPEIGQNVTVNIDRPAQVTLTEDARLLNLRFNIGYLWFGNPEGPAFAYNFGVLIDLPEGLTAVAVPGPIAGAGLPALMALGGFAWARRRRRTSGPAVAV